MTDTSKASPAEVGDGPEAFFFSYARERHAIHLRRQAGLPAPWTEDPVLHKYRFCQIFRELDRTTIWFRENVREPLRDKPEVLLATVLFRLFNRISTGEAIFCQAALGLEDELPGETAWDTFLRTGDVGPIRAAVLQYCSPGPYVTGSYIIKTPDGLNKLDGVLKIVEWFIEQDYTVPGDTGWVLGSPEPLSFSWMGAANVMLGCSRIGGSWSLEECWGWVKRFPFIGEFTAYEIVTDLRHTALLENAPDIMTWANPGPGAKRGLGWVYGETGPRKWQIEKMRELLEMSKDPRYWPPDWPSWEMREVEHTLCEFDKYTRVQNGGPAPRGVYRHG